MCNLTYASLSFTLENDFISRPNKYMAENLQIYHQLKTNINKQFANRYNN